jgi:hypothetical protein
MKVICKNNEYGTFTIKKKTSLTIGKSYDIIKREVKPSGTVLIRVLCDDGIEREYLDTRFLSKDEVREQVINNILNESNL